MQTSMLHFEPMTLLKYEALTGRLQHCISLYSVNLHDALILWTCTQFVHHLVVPVQILIGA